MTLLEMIDDALAILGDTNPTASRRARALRFLNRWLAALSADDLFIYATTKETHTLVAGTAEYTWGSGGNISTTRPYDIDNIFLRDDTTDSEVIVMTEGNYNKIVDKTAQGLPEKYVLIREYPLAKLIFSLTPDAAYVAHIASRKLLKAFTVADFNIDIVLPGEYELGILYNLVILLSPVYGQTISPATAKFAKDGLDIIVAQNATPVPEIKPEEGLPNGFN
jgi:hypothetical protein